MGNEAAINSYLAEIDAHHDEVKLEQRKAALKSASNDIWGVLEALECEDSTPALKSIIDTLGDVMNSLDDEAIEADLALEALSMPPDED